MSRIIPYTHTKRQENYLGYTGVSENNRTPEQSISQTLCWYILAFSHALRASLAKLDPCQRIFWIAPAYAVVNIINIVPSYLVKITSR